MSTGRHVSLTDRWGVQSDENATIEQFALLFDDLDEGDHEHCVVDISDDQEWYVEFSLDTVTFGNAEGDGDVGSLSLASRDEALAIAKEFIDGDLAALRARSWRA